MGLITSTPLNTHCTSAGSSIGTSFKMDLRQNNNKQQVRSLQAGITLCTAADRQGEIWHSSEDLMPCMINGALANWYGCECLLKKRYRVHRIGGRVEVLFSFWDLPPLTTVSFSWCQCNLLLVPDSVGRAPPLPLRGFGRSSSGSAGEGQRLEVHSVCGDGTLPPGGLQLQYH